MKYLKEYYDYSDMVKLPDGEIEKMAHTKSFKKFLPNRVEPERPNYTSLVKEMVLKNLPEFNNNHIHIKEYQSTSTMYFIISKEFAGRSFDIVLDITVFHPLKKLKVSLLFYINEDVYSDEEGITDEEVEENDRFLDTISFFDNRVTFETFETILNNLKPNISKYKKYCYGKYGVE